MARTTYCLGYWQIPENAKRPPAHYAQWLPRTLSMLAGETLLFMCDDAIVQRWVEGLAREHRLTLKTVRRRVSDLPAAGVADGILRQTARFGNGLAPPSDFHREKGLLHYWRDFQISGADAYRRLLTIWLSKVPLLAELAEADAFGSDTFAWVDATAARFNGERLNWDFAKLGDQANVITHYGSKMCRQGQELSINASFLKGGQPAWQRLAPLYQQALGRALEETYPNDEETVLHEVIKAHPDLFVALGRTAGAQP